MTLYFNFLKIIDTPPSFLPNLTTGVRFQTEYFIFKFEDSLLLVSKMLYSDF